jgi:hypothetical protein
MEDRMGLPGSLRIETVLLLFGSVMSIGFLSSTAAGAQARAPLFTADQEACFGRVYDGAHLASHPSQKVTSLHIFRSLGERPEAESWRPGKRDEAIKQFRETGEAEVQAFVTFRDRKGYFHNWLTCAKESKDGVSCHIECDGGNFSLKRDSASTAMLSNSGFVLIGGCGEDVEASEEVYFSPGKDDKLFRLEAKPSAVCRAEEQKARPIRPGKPLRERFQDNEAFCFGRDYDAAHLAKHPQQKVTSIRVGRLAPAEERLDKSLAQTWPEDVKLSVALTLKTGSARRAMKYACDPKEASWECTAESAADARSTCDGNTVHLARGEGDDILLINRREGLPIDAACQAKPADAPGDDHQRPTRSDDKTFRLSRMPVEACR